MAMLTLPRLDIATLSADPYPVFAELREREPVVWSKDLGMFLVTRYADVRAVLDAPKRFSNDSHDSLILRTFGRQMLSSEGAGHDRMKAFFAPRFASAAVKTQLADRLRQLTKALIEPLDGPVEIRAEFAARIPVQAMLAVFGLPLDLEPEVARLYRIFEAALANHADDKEVAAAAREGRERLHDLFADHLCRPIEFPGEDGDWRRELSIIFFGGISTVEATILNALWVVLSGHAAIPGDAGKPLDRHIEETVRWSGPVQSATRHAVADDEIAGVAIPEGATVNCMIASANRDPQVFGNANRFDPCRRDLGRHLGFAAGVHHCLGLHLARLETRIALEALLLGDIVLEPRRLFPLEGHEFRKPRRLDVNVVRKAGRR